MILPIFYLPVDNVIRRPPRVEKGEVGGANRFSTYSTYVLSLHSFFLQLVTAEGRRGGIRGQQSSQAPFPPPALSSPNFFLSSSQL